MPSSDTVDASASGHFASQLRASVLEGLAISEARNTDRYLGSANGHANGLMAKGYPLNPALLKDLENTFAGFREEVFLQAIALITWRVTESQELPATVLLRASEKTFAAVYDYTDRLAEDQWHVRVTPALNSIAYEEGQSPTSAIASVKARLLARAQADELRLRKALFDAIMAVLYQRDLRNATLSNARAAEHTKDLTAAIVRGTAVIAVGTVFQAASAIGLVDWLLNLLSKP